MDIDNKDNIEKINISDEKMNLGTIIINNTNKMNINNINFKKSFFGNENLLPQRTISEAFYVININNYIKNNYVINKGDKSFISNDIYKYIENLCNKAIDYLINSINLNMDKKNDIKNIIIKNVIKYLNELINAEWFVLINDLSEDKNFEFSFSDYSNYNNLIFFKYKNYRIYIGFLFLKLKNDFIFEIEEEDKEKNIFEKKINEENIIEIKGEDNKNKIEKNEKKIVNEEKEFNIIDKEKENDDINDIINEKNIIIKEEEIRKNDDINNAIKLENNINDENNIIYDEKNNINKEGINTNINLNNNIGEEKKNLDKINDNVNEEKSQKKIEIIDSNKENDDKINDKENYCIERKDKLFNRRFQNRRQYYKNKNKIKDLTFIEKNKEKEEEKENNKEEKNIFSIYNLDNIFSNEQNINKPNDLIEPTNLYYLRQDIRICNPDIENDKELYNNLQKRIKRMLTKTKIPIFNFDNYKIIKTIGEGTYGQLYSVINNNTKKSYAMKELVAQDINYFYQCLNALEINYHNKHQNILDIYGIYAIIFEEKSFFIYALMDLAEGDWEAEIRQRKNNKKFYTEDELISILKQLVSALSFLQKRSIAHRDIKLENILLFPNEDKNGLDKIYKIGDFGEAKNKIKYNVILNTIRGTDYYMSPELLEGINNQKDFVMNNPHKSDTFSLGCCMMIAATLNYEIINDIRNPQTQGELNSIIKSELEKNYSEKFSDLITKMLVINENNRTDFINLEILLKRKY